MKPFEFKDISDDFKVVDVTGMNEYEGYKLKRHAIIKYERDGVRIRFDYLIENSLSGSNRSYLGIRLYKYGHTE